jgi:hypothetical protein
VALEILLVNFGFMLVSGLPLWPPAILPILHGANFKS